MRSKWRDMKVIGNWVYIVSEASNHGMQVSNIPVPVPVPTVYIMY